jgi:hypothetical protein
VPQHQQLRGRGRVASGEECEPGEHPNHDQIQQPNRHEPIVQQSGKIPAHRPCLYFWNGTGRTVLLRDSGRFSGVAPSSASVHVRPQTVRSLIETLCWSRGNPGATKARTFQYDPGRQRVRPARGGSWVGLVRAFPFKSKSGAQLGRNKYWVHSNGRLRLDPFAALVPSRRRPDLPLSSRALALTPMRQLTSVADRLPDKLRDDLLVGR